MKRIFSQGVSETLSGLQKEANRLATEDFHTISEDIRGQLRGMIEQRPFETVAIAVGVGFGLGTLNSSHFKAAGLRVGKLLAMKALGDIEPKSASAPQLAGEITQAKGGEHGPH